MTVKEDASNRHPVANAPSHVPCPNRAQNFGHGTTVIPGVTWITVCFKASGHDVGTGGSRVSGCGHCRSSEAQSAGEADWEGALENKVPERRRFARYQCSLPVQLHVAGQAYPTSTETTDISLGGCYVKMLVPLPVGTVVEVRIGADNGEIKVKGTIKTADPSLGNGIAFTEMASSCQLDLQRYLQTLPEVNARSAGVIR